MICVEGGCPRPSGTREARGPLIRDGEDSNRQKEPWITDRKAIKGRRAVLTEKSAVMIGSGAGREIRNYQRNDDGIKPTENKSTERRMSTIALGTE